MIFTNQLKNNLRLLLFLIFIILLNVIMGCSSVPKKDDARIIMYAHKGNIEKVQEYLDAGFDVNAQDAQGHTLLHYALNARQVAMAEHLLNRGANPNLEDSFGVTPFDIVLIRRMSSLFDLMMQSGADVNYIHKDGMVPLHFAIDSDYLPMVTLLTLHGARLDIKDKEGQTPLEYAKEFPEIYHYLKGISQNIK